MASNTIPLPMPIKITGNPIAEWKRFHSQWNNYEIATDLTDKPSSKRAAVLLACVGSDAYEVFETLDISVDDRKKVDKVIAALENHFVGETNQTYERYVFNRRQQEPNENFDTFLSDLRRLIRTCEYGNQEDSIMRDRVVIGIRDDATRKKLLQNRKLDLKTAIDVCKSCEAASKQLRDMTQQHDDDVHALDKRRPPRRQRSKSPQRRDSGIATYKKQQNVCSRCGNEHEARKCPAYGRKCSNCKGMNHFAKMCRSKARSRDHTLNQLDQDSDDDSEDVLALASSGISRVYSHLEVEGRTIKFLLDCGSTVNLLPYDLVSDMHLPVKNDNSRLRMFDGHTLSTVGITNAKVCHPKTRQVQQLEFHVTAEYKQPLLSLDACLLFELMEIKEENICSVERAEVDALMTKYAELFNGYGKLPGEIHLELKEDAQPAITPVRKIPVPMKAKVAEKLQQLQHDGIITPVTKPTEWMSALVVVNKPSGDIRLCIDPKPLNQALRRDHYSMPTIDDVLPLLGKAKVFSSIDAKDAFWHIVLDEPSSYLTTFGTPYGKFRWLRIPYGIAPAPEIWQRKLHEALAGLKGVFCVADDIIVFGSGDTYEEAKHDHDDNLHALLRRCIEKHIRLSKQKMKLWLQSLKFVGHELTVHGLRRDPSKVDAIMHMPIPSDVEGVRRLLGMATFLSRYIPRFSDVTAPLRQLMNSDEPFYWDQTTHGLAFDNLKRCLASDEVLAYYDVSKPVVIQCDSSQSGLGAVLLQDNRPVEYASHSLSPTEQSYAQIEKELLAIVFGLERLHSYVYGRHTIVETDHKPLLSIVKKPLTSAPKRLQRMLLRLQKYDFELHYRPGTQVIIADTLSRAYPQSTDPVTSFDEDIASLDQAAADAEQELRMVASKLTISRIKAAAHEDPVYQQLRQQIIKGWPDSGIDVPQEIRTYITFADELAVYGDLVFKGTRVVVPAGARADMLERIHSSHIGINGCIRRARDVLYWPGMVKEIKAKVERCAVCQEYQHANVKEPLMSHDIPSRPWEKIGIDIFTHSNYDYLIEVDYLSGFFEIDRLPTKAVHDIVYCMKQQFARHGIPDIVMSDNSPFNSREFRAFATNYEFQHVTSSPRYPQSNGRVENAVKTAKRLMTKAREDKRDPYLALLEWRNTPSDSMGTSPAQIIFGRRTRSLLPAADVLLKPERATSAAERLTASKTIQKNYYDRGTRVRAPLAIGQTVRFKADPLSSDWQKGEIASALPFRSYDIRTEDGSVRRRSSRHIKRSNEPPIVIDDPSPDMQAPPLAHSNSVAKFNVSAPRAKNTTKSKAGVTSGPSTQPDTTSMMPSPLASEPANATAVVASTKRPYVTRYGREIKAPAWRQKDS